MQRPVGSAAVPVLPVAPEAKAAFASPLASSPAPLSPAEIAQRAMPSVTLIRLADGLGSGFIVTAEGKIATNYHVIRGSSTATVVLSDGREFKDPEVMAVDEEHDLAILRVPLSGLRPLPLGDSGAVLPGARVVAIGHPLGFGNTVTDGLVSAVRKLDDNLTILQISAPISPGSSGGPILDEHGTVIGVSTLMSTRGQNLNFGMPVAYLRPLLASDKSMPIAVFAALDAEANRAGGKATRKRAIPKHPLSSLAGCSNVALARTRSSIAEAISVGAPLYNDGNHEACFRIYQGAALGLTRELKGCAGVKRALADGLTHAGKVKGDDDKAWAMRDAFDGLIDVIERRLGEGGPE